MLIIVFDQSEIYLDIKINYLRNIWNCWTGYTI